MKVTVCNGFFEVRKVEVLRDEPYFFALRVLLEDQEDDYPRVTASMPGLGGVKINIGTDNYDRDRPKELTSVYVDHDGGEWEAVASVNLDQTVSICVFRSDRPRKLRHGVIVDRERTSHEPTP